MRGGPLHGTLGGGANFGEGGFHAGFSGGFDFAGVGFRGSLDLGRGGFHPSFRFTRGEADAGGPDANAASIRNSWSYWGRWNGAASWYGADWRAAHPGAWRAAGWTAATPWRATPYAGLASRCGLRGAAPAGYDYGKTVVYQGDQVSVNGQPAAPAREYYQQASRLAAAGQAAPPGTGDWKPLGVFGMAPPRGNSASQIFQLAVDRRGILGGNCTNLLTNSVLPIHGSVDPQTQRAAWTVGMDTTAVYEAGLENLTQVQAPCLVHTGAESRQLRLLVRLQQPTDRAPGQSGECYGRASASSRCNSARSTGFVRW